MRPAGRLAALLLAMTTIAVPCRASAIAYKYDTLGRLIEVDYPSGYSITYAYDAAGNRTVVASRGAAAPVANDDSIPTPDGTSVSFDPKHNDTDTNQFALTIVAPLGTPSSGGTAVLNADNTVTYTPPTTSYSGTDSFTYTISDGHGGTAQATVTVTMNSAPVAVDDNAAAYNVQPGVPATVTLDPRVNDTDPDNDHLSIKSVGTPVNGGSAQKNGGASVTYTAPNAGFVGTDSFTYVVKDGQGNNATATVHVIVQNVSSN
jgi:YD repeat-containing protein